jgi:hypothetical protein
VFALCDAAGSEHDQREEEKSLEWAQIREVGLVDDLDGQDADETVEFGIDGKNYEIDLSSTANAGRLRDGLADFDFHRPPFGRRPPAAAPVRAAPAVLQEPHRRGALWSIASKPGDSGWARKRGLKVSDRGRISSDVVEAYHNAAQ